MTQDGFLSGSNLEPEEMQQMLQRWRENRTPREHAEGLLRPRFTFLELQLDAIKELIHRHQQAEAVTWIKFKELDMEIEANPNNEQLDGLREDRFWKAVFMDSAHSMAVVGMLAPFIESLFDAIFDRLKHKVTLPTDHRRNTLGERDIWNPQWYAARKAEDSRKDIVLGIKQLAGATGFKTYLPPGHEPALEALFAFRNNMLHNGFEWPTKKVKLFTKRIASEGWPDDWFSGTDRGEDPWLYY
ncbi:hypothetical protein ACOI1H_24175, partial [Loktanella sp. DJP18]|uniref:hypothetical protein n=1 Tax=Loktanella sp. DJP18 TaxID=3409788 RepID=UPI003BB76B78